MYFNNIHQNIRQLLGSSGSGMLCGASTAPSAAAAASGTDFFVYYSNFNLIS